MKVKTLLNQKLRRALGLVSVLALAACTSFPPTVPMEMPFGLGKGGESVEFDFCVKKTYGHVVRLEFLFHKEELEDRHARRALMDQLGARFAANDSIPFVRVPITLRIRVKSIEVQGPPVEFDHTTDQIGFVYASEKFAMKEVQMRINNQKLQPGTYHIHVDNLHPVPEFADRTVRIAISYAEQGK